MKYENQLRYPNMQYITQVANPDPEGRKPIPLQNPDADCAPL